jgi:hypothetical protein
MAEMLRLGVPFEPEHAPILLPIAASLMQQQEIDLKIFSWGRMWDWRGHEAMVHLALQMQETRLYDRRVAERQAEVRLLEAELRALAEKEEEKARQLEAARLKKTEEEEGRKKKKTSTGE